MKKLTLALATVSTQLFAQTNTEPAQVVVVKTYDWDIAKLAGDAAPIMVGVLAVGAILKHVFPALSNRWIPLITWTLGTVAFVLKSQDYSLTSMIVGLLACAAATGLHSGAKNTVEKDEDKPTEP